MANRRGRGGTRDRSGRNTRAEKQNKHTIPAAKGPNSVLVIACGALAREILSLRDANGLQHLQLHCLPADLHLWPDRIPDAVESAVRAARAVGHTTILLPMLIVGLAGCSPIDAGPECRDACRSALLQLL